MDSWLSAEVHFSVPSFVLDGVPVVERGVKSLSVAEDFDALKNRPARFVSRGKAQAMAQLLFEGRQEAFCDGIVPAIPGCQLARGCEGLRRSQEETHTAPTTASTSQALLPLF